MADSFTPDSFTADAAPAGDSFAPDVAPPAEGTLSKLKHALGTGLKAVGKAGAYLQGATVSPLVALGTEAYTGKPVFHGDEYLKGLDPRNLESYPSPTEMLARGGIQIPRGPSVHDAFPSAKDKWYDASAGGVADFALNTATDPSTYLSAGLSAAAKGGKEASVLAKLTGAMGLANESGLTKGGAVANAALNPVEAWNRARAPKLYDKAFEDVNRVASEGGKALKPSDLLRETGFQGGAQDAVGALEKINQEAGAKAGGILKDASQEKLTLGGGVRPAAKLQLLDSFKPAMEFASELRKKPFPEAAQLAQKIDDRIEYALTKSGGELTAASANELKSDLNTLIKDSGFAQGTEASLETQARRALSTDLGKGVRESVKAVDPELEQALGHEWQKYAASSPSIRDKMSSIASQSAQKRGPFGLTAVDALLLGGGGLGALTGDEGSRDTALGALLAKKFFHGARSIEGRTLRGKLAETIGQKSGGMVDTAVRQGVWDNLSQKSKNGETQ